MEKLAFFDDISGVFDGDFALFDTGTSAERSLK
jgi:hypothetical protein